MREMSTSSSRSRQQILYGECCNGLSVENQRDRIADVVGRRLAVGGGCGRPRRLLVHLDLAINEIDDPVNRHTGTGVNSALIETIPGKSGIGNLDQGANLAGRREVSRVVA